MRRCRRSTWGASTDGLVRRRRSRHGSRPVHRAGGRGPRRLLRPCPRAAGREPVAGARRARHRRAQRHGQDHAVQRAHRAGAGARQRALRRRGDPGPGAQRDHAPRHRLRAAGPARVALALGRRDAAAGGQPPARGRPRLCDVPAAGGAARQWRRPALGRRAADARDRPRAAVEPQAAGDGRADRGPGTGHRRPGGAGAARPRGRRPHRGAADRAEPRRGDLGGRPHRADGQRPHRARDAGGRTRGRPRAAGEAFRRALGRPWRRGRAGATGTAHGRGRRPRQRAARLHRAPRPWRRRTLARRPRAGQRARLHALERRRHGRARGRHPAPDRTARARARTGAVRGRLGPGVRLPGGREQRARGLRGRHLRHQEPRAVLPAPVHRAPGPARGHGRPLDLGQALDRERASARGGTPPSQGRVGGVQRRPRQRHRRHGPGLRGLPAHAARPRRPDLGRRLGRHLDGHAGHARAADRRAQAHGLNHGQRRHTALRGPERHLHDVFGHRRAGHQPHQRERAVERSQCAGRHGGASGFRVGRDPARHRPHDVRRDHALRAGRDAAARG